MGKVLAFTAIVFLCTINVHANYPVNSPFDNIFLNFPPNCPSECTNEVIDKDVAVQLTPFPEPATLVILGLGTILISVKKRPNRT